MYNVDTGAYHGPVTSAEQLLHCLELPAEFDPTIPPEYHSITVKTCNSPYLLARSLGSIRYRLEEKQANPLVVDDSKNINHRTQNRTLCFEFESDYCAVLGKYSLVQPFAEYIMASSTDKTEGERLTSYLERIVTDYPVEPKSNTWGGVAGTQNLGHLANVMNFGQEQLRPEQWLATFIDDDVLMPVDASEIFRMIGIYHHVGKVGIIASNYLHHSGNPMSLAKRSLQYLVEQGDKMTDDEIHEEMDNIFRRTPTVGLRNRDDSNEDYSTPELTMIFPGGNYSLSGPKAFDIPVPVVGIDDVGYGTLLQTFIGSRGLGVARVPDFPHIRFARDSGGDAHGQFSTLDKFVEVSLKDRQHVAFHKIVEAYAIFKEKVPEQNITDLHRRQEISLKRQAGNQTGVSRAAAQLMDRERFGPYRDILSVLRKGVGNVAASQSMEMKNHFVDPEFARRFVADMRLLQPQLVKKAYEFGAGGELEAYRARVKKSTPRI